MNVIYQGNQRLHSGSRRKVSFINYWLSIGSEKKLSPEDVQFYNEQVDQISKHILRKIHQYCTQGEIESGYAVVHAAPNEYVSNIEYRAKFVEENRDTIKEIQLKQTSDKIYQNSCNTHSIDSKDEDFLYNQLAYYIMKYEGQLKRQ